MRRLALLHRAPEPSMTVSAGQGQPIQARVYDRCSGAIDREWLDAFAAALYEVNANPRKAAEVAFVTPHFEFRSDEN